MVGASAVIATSKAAAGEVGVFGLAARSLSGVTEYLAPSNGSGQQPSKDAVKFSNVRAHHPKRCPAYPSMSL
jgi:hypothetical protein